MEFISCKIIVCARGFIVLWQELVEKLHSVGKVDTSDEHSDTDLQLSRLAERVAAEVSENDIQTQVHGYGRSFW